MRQTPLSLSTEDRSAIEEIRSKGLHQAREVNRAHVLSRLYRGIPEAQIIVVLGIGRTEVWRARAAYLQRGRGISGVRRGALRASVPGTTPTPRRK